MFIDRNESEDKMRDINLLKNNGIDVDSALELLGDMETYDEILNDFLEGSKERLSSIEEYKKNKDMKNYAIQVHAMKGDSKYLGFSKLADMSFEHQLKSEANDYNYIHEHYDELIKEAKCVIQLVQEYLEK